VANIRHFAINQKKKKKKLASNINAQGNNFLENFHQKYRHNLRIFFEIAKKLAGLGQILSFFFW
jgi:hypothetical protein